MSYFKTERGLGAIIGGITTPMMAMTLSPELLAQIQSTVTAPFPGAVLMEGKWVKPPFPNAVWVPASGGVRGHWETKKAAGGPTVTVARTLGTPTAGQGDPDKAVMGWAMTPGGRGLLPRMGNIDRRYLNLLFRAQGSEKWQALATAAGVEWKYPYSKKFHYANYRTVPMGSGGTTADQHTHPEFFWGQVGAADAPTASGLARMLKAKGWTEAKMESTKAQPAEEAKLKRYLAILAHDYVAKWSDKMLNFTQRTKDPHWDRQIGRNIKAKEDLAEGKRDRRTSSVCPGILPEYRACCEEAIRGGMDVYEFRTAMEAGDPRVISCFQDVDNKKSRRTLILAAGGVGVVLLGALLYKRGK